MDLEVFCAIESLWFDMDGVAEIEDCRCVFCGECIELVPHLFLYCRVTIQIWDRIFQWLGLPFMLPHNLTSLPNSVIAFPGNKLLRQGLIAVWSVVI
jgi:hypothetical protein